MKHTIRTATGVKATFSFEARHEEIFVLNPADSVLIQQDGDLIFVPASDFRAFLKALSEWADEAGIPA